MTDDPHVGEEYRHADGPMEVVVAVTGDRVLTLREYEDVDAFRTAIRDAESLETNPMVEDLSTQVFGDPEEEG